MSSGGKREIINNRERAVSTDINRAQAFLRTDISDALRFWLLSQTSLTGAETTPSGIGAPLAMTILGGFLVRPDFAGQTLTIDPGVAVINRPDAAPSGDDTVAKYVNDPGISNVLTLPWVANVSGSIRVDVVECAVVGEDGAGAGSGETVLETDNRDIYDTGTGLFTPALVNKVEAVRFQYRIRHGTGGAGFPGTAAGWRPLAVICMPSGGATYGAAIIYDVRPLLSDFAVAANVARRNRVTYVNATAGWEYEANTGVAIAKYWNGTVEAVFQGRVVGGDAPPGGFDMSVECTPTFVGALADGWWHMYLAFPYGLPRWARYSGAAPMLPTSMRGIVIASQQAPDGDTGQPQVAIAPPAATGLLTTTTNAFRVFTGPVKAISFFQPTIATSDGWYSMGFGNVAAVAAPGAAPTIGGYEVKSFDLVENVSVPIGATGARLLATTSWTASNATKFIDAWIETSPESIASSVHATGRAIMSEDIGHNIVGDGATARSMGGVYKVAFAPSSPGPAPGPWSAHTHHCAYIQKSDNASSIAAAAAIVVTGYKLY